MASSLKTSETRSGWCASMPAFQRSRASRSASVSGTLTSIHVQDRTGDKRRVLQIQHGLDDVVDVTHAPQRMPFGQCIVCRRIVHGGANVAEMLTRWPPAPPLSIADTAARETSKNPRRLT